MRDGCLVGVVVRIGLSGVLVLALAGAAVGVPGPASRPGGALPLSESGRPTLIVAEGARLESVDPQTGNVLGSIAPVTIPGFTWNRFLRRGRFLLADGQTPWVTAPVRHSVRGLVLIDGTGSVLWADTHVETLNRASRAVFLDEGGSVAFDSIDGSMLVLRDGTRLEVDGTPAGPVVSGTPGLLPVRKFWEDVVDHWLTIGPGGAMCAGDGKLPADRARRLPLRPTPGEDGRLALLQVVDPAPESEMDEVAVKTVARLPAPPRCRGLLQSTWPTMSPRHWILVCEPETDDEGRSLRPGAMYVVDVARRQLHRVQPPTSDVSDQPRGFRRPDDVDATVLPDGTMLASVWNNCTTNVLLSKPGGGWKGAGVHPPFGPQFAPALVCGRLTLQPTLLPPNMGCSGARPGPAAYVRRPNGSWLELPYKVAAHRAENCSPDGEVVAFIADGALTTARLDRPEQTSVHTGLTNDAPMAWLP